MFVVVVVVVVLHSLISDFRTQQIFFRVCLFFCASVFYHVL